MYNNSVQFSSIIQLCPTLCDPMDCSMPGFPVHHQLPELAQTHNHQWHHPTISFSVVTSSWHQYFPVLGSFLVNQLFTSGGQNIGASALASVLSMNIQDWFPLGSTSLISLKSKGLSRVFSSTTVQSINSPALSLYGLTLTSIHDYWKNHDFD